MWRQHSVGLENNGALVRFDQSYINMMERGIDMELEVKICEKALLTLQEASAYTGIGINKLRDLSDSRNCDFVLFVGNKRLLKRERLVNFLNNEYSI